MYDRCVDWPRHHDAKTATPPLVGTKRWQADLPRVCAHCGGICTRQPRRCRAGGLHARGQGASFSLFEAAICSGLMGIGLALSNFLSASLLLSGMVIGCLISILGVGDVIASASVSALLLTVVRRWVVRRQKRGPYKLGDKSGPEQPMRGPEHCWSFLYPYQFRHDHTWVACALVASALTPFAVMFEPRVCVAVLFVAGYCLLRSLTWEARVRL